MAVNDRGARAVIVTRSRRLASLAVAAAAAAPDTLSQNVAAVAAAFSIPAQASADVKKLPKVFIRKKACLASTSSGSPDSDLEPSRPAIIVKKLPKVTTRRKACLASIDAAQASAITQLDPGQPHRPGEASAITEVDPGQPHRPEQASVSTTVDLIKPRRGRPAKASASMPLDAVKPRRNDRRTTLHRETEKRQLILSSDKSQCSFCTVNMKENEGVMLDSCLHVFCRDCLVATIELQESAQVVCPTGCGGIMLEKEIRALVPPEMYDSYLDRSMKLAMNDLANVFKCKTEGCSGWCEYEEGRKIFHCYVCTFSNCVPCRAIHDGTDCKTYQELMKRATIQNVSVKELLLREINGGWTQLQGQVNHAKSDLGNWSSLLNTALLKSSQVFECAICFMEISAGDGVILQECLHMFCRECLIGVTEHADDTEVKCPYMDANYSCTNYLKPREISALVSAEVYEAHLQKSLRHAESAITNSYHCKTPDCRGWCEIEGSVDVFDCPVCQKTNCLKCNAIHGDVSCEDYKNRLVQDSNDQLSTAALDEEVRLGQSMRCPKCKAVVQKVAGCDFIICSGCRLGICWATKGPRWGPNGEGDNSGGCKCRIGGKLCVPHCGNCH